VNTPELFALWRTIGDVSKDPAIGLKLGTETRLERFHPSGIAALSAETFGASIDCMAKYKKLSVPEEIVQQKDDLEWTIRFRWTLAMDVEPMVLVEHCFAWLLTIARRGTDSDGYTNAWTSRSGSHTTTGRSTGWRYEEAAPCGESRQNWRSP
jgi:hypothetical protein